MFNLQIHECINYSIKNEFLCRHVNLNKKHILLQKYNDQIIFILHIYTLKAVFFFNFIKIQFYIYSCFVSIGTGYKIADTKTNNEIRKNRIMTVNTGLHPNWNTANNNTIIKYIINCLLAKKRKLILGGKCTAFLDTDCIFFDLITSKYVKGLARTLRQTFPSSVC